MQTTNFARMGMKFQFRTPSMNTGGIINSSWFQVATQKVLLDYCDYNFVLNGHLLCALGIYNFVNTVMQLL
ncbi:hypothetical protein TSUD_127580 [Trifolium subterraneum]|nr:hypothetical protein TSUD_127580 [Trifolium subterraneum]